ncbi:MAG: hypothetical protein KJ906_01530, partial [Nanoarchaeota archaeon]|nr:hypothetical protein [Nanoarchaeota archaeon]
MIKGIQIQEILNSRSQKSIKVILKTNKGMFYGCAPSGASTGKYEARTTSNKIAIKEFDK